MGLTIQQVAQRLLFRIGVVSLDPNLNANSANAAGLDPVNDIAEVLDAINGAFQETWALGPAEAKVDRLSFQIYPPTAVILTCSALSTTISGLTTSASWMPGCTIRISGDPYDNELVSPTKLVRPYQGANGVQSATVFCDALAMPSTVQNVTEPVMIPGIVVPIVPAASRVIFERTFLDYWHQGNVPAYQYAYRYAQNKVTGIPRIWFAEDRYDPTLGYTPIMVRLNPMPSQAWPITTRVLYKPPVFTAADIASSSPYTDPGTMIPQEWNESIILPIALMRFRAHPSFNDRPGVLAEMQRQFDRAQLILDSLRPQLAATVANYNA